MHLQMMHGNLRPEAKPWAPRVPPNTLNAASAPNTSILHPNMNAINGASHAAAAPAVMVSLPPKVSTTPDPTSHPQGNPNAAKLFVGQLPFESDEKRLYDLFSAYGNVEHIHVLRDPNNRSKGAAFVTYSNVEEADTAIFTLHNRYKMLANRMIQVSYAKNSPNISSFGAWSAIAVHQMNPTNPVPDIAGLPPETRFL